MMQPDCQGHTLTVVMPCYNEAATLAQCIENVVAIADDRLKLDMIIVDDGSTDDSLALAESFSRKYACIRVVAHEYNQGKGAALRTGLALAAGDYVAVQDADLEYDPQDLKQMLVPLNAGKADVVIGSRFLSCGAHRVLYFWHALGNRFLTLLSNMFTDLNLTDMESGYKVFRREILQQLEIREDRFGFEPEIIAKISHMRVRIFEMGISYHGRTYAEGKKIQARDGLWALYCIFRYNAHRAPWPIQFMLYLLIGVLVALINLSAFALLRHFHMTMAVAAPLAFGPAAVVNYLLCIALLFRHQARWGAVKEVCLYAFTALALAWGDFQITHALFSWGTGPIFAKTAATVVWVLLTFWVNRLLIFSEPGSGPWQPLIKT